MNFYNIEDLKLFLENDRHSKDLCPIRFINVETMDMWVKVKSFLTKICPGFIRLSDLCAYEDTMPNINQLKSRIKKAGQNTLVVPLSEHLRVNNASAIKTINDIIALNFENNLEQDLKIYIPIYRMKELFRNIDADGRYKKTILFLNHDSDCDYSLTVVQNNLKVSIKGNEINGYKKYLVYWEQNPDKPIILHTQNAIYYKDVVFSDDVKVIVNSFDLLKYHFGISKNINEQWGSEEKWAKIVSLFKGYQNIEAMFCNTLLVSNFNIRLFENWKQKKEFERWLIWIWAKCSNISGYLEYALDASEEFVDFERNLFNSVVNIINDNNYTKQYWDRKQLILLMGIIPGNDFWIKIDALDPQSRIKCLTDNTEREKNEIILSWRECTFKNSLMQILESVYPELFYYLAESNFENQDINNYFLEYKRLKSRNECTQEFKDQVERLAKEQGEKIWALKSRNLIIQEEYDDNSIIYYVDALGVEYISLLQYLFKKAGVNFTYRIGCCNIPSTTEKNNDFYDGKKFEAFYELDKLKHSLGQYPQNLIKEFDLLIKIVNRALELLVDNKKVIIASDHGASRLAILGKGQSLEAKDGAVKYKFGRYCEDSVNQYNDYQGCIREGNYWIFANYNRFSGQGAPLGETHGGATFEEVIVPIICIDNDYQVKKDEEIVINLLTPVIKLPVSKKIKVEFELNGQFDKLTAIVKNKRYLCKFDSGKYSFEPEVGKDEIYLANIVEKEIIGSFEYKVTKPISSNFDI